MFSKQISIGVLSFLLSTDAVSAIPRHSSHRSLISLHKRAPFGGIQSFDGQPQPPPDFSTSIGPQPKQPYEYECFGQEGKPYPHEPDFISFDSMWQVNEQDVVKVNGGSQDTADTIKNAIIGVSKRTNMFPQYTLAVVMQEVRVLRSLTIYPLSNRLNNLCTSSKLTLHLQSVGNLNAPCTAGSQGQSGECGLMQASPNGTVGQGNSSITQQIVDGLLGTDTGGPHGWGRCGFVQIFSGNTQCLSGSNSIVETKPVDIWPFWAGARIYNSGNANPDNLQELPNGYGRPEYVMDIANRVLGWTGQHSELQGDQTCGV